jgi:hypothetical protein
MLAVPRAGLRGEGRKVPRKTGAIRVDPGEGSRRRVRRSPGGSPARGTASVYSPCTVRLFSGPSSSTNPTCVSCGASKISTSTRAKPTLPGTGSLVSSAVRDVDYPLPTKAGKCSWLLGRSLILGFPRGFHRLLLPPATSSTVRGSSACMPNDFNHLRSSAIAG